MISTLYDNILSSPVSMYSHEDIDIKIIQQKLLYPSENAEIYQAHRKMLPAVFCDHVIFYFI